REHLRSRCRPLSRSGHGVGVGVGCAVCLFCCFCLLHASAVIVVGVCGFFVACCVHRLSPPCMCLCVVGVGGVCVTSCEGHVVDALASRADEGRRSLR